MSTDVCGLGQRQSYMRLLWSTYNETEDVLQAAGVLRRMSHVTIDVGKDAVPAPQCCVDSQPTL